jgi:hypothetical protein
MAQLTIKYTYISPDMKTGSDYHVLTGQKWHCIIHAAQSLTETGYYSEYCIAVGKVWDSQPECK